MCDIIIKLYNFTDVEMYIIIAASCVAGVILIVLLILFGLRMGGKLRCGKPMTKSGGYKRNIVTPTKSDSRNDVTTPERMDSRQSTMAWPPYKDM